MSPDLGSLEGMPLDEEGPVFQEPWEAMAFALAVELSERGLFTWREWAEALAEEIQAAQEAGVPDLGDTYYEHWTRALAKLVAANDAVTPAEIESRTEQWRQAYLATPHGRPVELSAARSGIGESTVNSDPALQMVPDPEDDD